MSDPGPTRGGARDKLSLLRGATRAIISARKLRYGDIATAADLDSRSASEAFRPDAFDFYVHPIYEAFFGYRRCQNAGASSSSSILAARRQPGLFSLQRSRKPNTNSRISWLARRRSPPTFSGSRLEDPADS